MKFKKLRIFLFFVVRQPPDAIQLFKPLYQVLATINIERLTCDRLSLE